jgi:UTP--glucose-1-phosphate uridylyltransferase
MLPVVDSPVIQYVVEEAVASGIEDILIIVSRGKRAVEEHFDRHPELERVLTSKGRTTELQAIRYPSSLARIHFTWQKTMAGLGDAVACARDHVGDEPFAVLLGDTLVASGMPVTRQLMDVHARYGGAVVGLEEIPLDKTSRYGVIRGESVGGQCYRIEDLVEKPSPALAPSKLAIAGRYVLVPAIFDVLDRTQPDSHGEVQLTDALRGLAHAGELHGLRFEGRRYDVGNKLDWLKANVSLGLAREDLGPEFRSFLTELLTGTAEQRAQAGRAFE